MSHSSTTLEALHKLSTRTRDVLQGDRECGRFYCLRTFAARTIEDWAPESEGEEVTALCPFCGIDSVVPSRDGESLDTDVLQSMHAYWFERTVQLSGPDLVGKFRMRLEPVLRRLTWDLWESRKGAG